jgi:hypothetical protein
LKSEFSTFDITTALNIPRGRLREWMNFGFVKPSVSAEGAGTKAIFTFNDVCAVALFRNLIDFGFSRDAAGKFLEAFKKRLEIEKDRTKYPETVYVIFRAPGRGRQELDDVQRVGPGAWKFDIESGYIDWRLSNPKLKLTGKEVRIPPLKDGEVEPPPYKDKNWRNIHIVNFGTLRKEVDAVMSKL